MTYPQTMRAAILYGKEDIRMETIPVPVIGPDEVLVQIKAALTCGTDLKVYRRGYHAKMLKPPTVFGHEFSGIITQVGEEVTKFKPGMSVVAANSAPCGKCFYCQKNKPNLCEDLLFINGAYAEYIRIPSRIVQKNLYPFPESVSYSSAAMVEPLACVVRGVEETGIQSGDIVTVLGTGPIALMYIQIAKIYGAKVISVGRRKEPLEKAIQLGADFTVNTSEVEDVIGAVKSLTEGQRGTDVVIEAIGQPEWWEKAVLMVGKGGTVNFYGGCPSRTSIQLDTELIHYSELTLKATFHHTPDYIQKALKFIVEGKISTLEYISTQEPLECVPEVFQRLVNGKHNIIKIAIIP